MFRLDDACHADGMQRFLDGIRNLLRKPLLNLQPLSEHIYDAGNFANSDDFALRQICHVCEPKKWKQVMLAHAEKFDIPHDDNIIDLFLKYRAVYELAKRLLVAACHIAHRVCGPVGRL
jgi:hypothetical protein